LATCCALLVFPVQIQGKFSQNKHQRHSIAQKEKTTTTKGGKTIEFSGREKNHRQ